MKKISKSQYDKYLNPKIQIERPINSGDILIEAIITKLGTRLSSPEEVIIKQDDPGNEIYYISSGDCSINIRDERRNVLVAEKLLVEGDHFGEISVIYGCKRTATVVSRNYNTMASIVA